jgi:hypothetical protein
LNAVKEPGRAFRLVPLERAYEMDFYPGSGMPFPKGRKFFRPLLNAVLAKKAEAGFMGFFHRFRGMEFAYPHEVNFFPLPAAAEAGGRDSFFQPGKSRGNIIHG